MKKKKQSWYGKLSFKKRRTVWGIIFLLPWIVGMLMFFTGPLIKTIYYSFNEMKMGVNGITFTFVGLDNFKDALTVNPDFNKYLISALAEACLNVPIIILVSLFVALLLNGEYRGRGLFRLIFFIPIILATGLTSMELSNTTYIIAQESSKTIINTQFLANFFVSSGLPEQFVFYILGFISTIFDVISTSGIQMLIFLAGLQAISSSLYEVAKIEGATTYEIFCKITLPMVSPMILLCVVYSFADSLYRAELTDKIYNVAFVQSRYGLSAAMSTIFMIVSIMIIGIVSLLISRKVFYYDK